MLIFSFTLHSLHLLLFPVSKREAEAARLSPRKTTNGKTGEVGGKGERTGGGATDKKDSMAKRNWQLEEAIDTPPETALAVYRSSVPASARASLRTAPNLESSNSLSSNGSLLNGGGSQKAPAGAHDIEMQMVMVLLDLLFSRF